MNDVTGIYCIENITNNKKYIGQSIHVYKRWAQHKNALRNNVHENDHLQASWNKHGESSFNFYMLIECEESLLDHYEVLYIKQYNTILMDFGYNLDSGGSCGNKHPSDETRKKMSENHADVSGKNNPNYGVVASEEKRRKISENHADVKGEKNPNYGKHHSDEAKEKISVANKGKQALSGEMHPMYGKHHSEESKSKISKSISGEKHPRCRPVYCIELDEYFWGATEAQNKYGICKDYICACCSGKQKSAGKHPVTGEPLHWIYADNLTLQNN